MTALAIENELTRLIPIGQQAQPLRPADLGGDVGIGSQFKRDTLWRGWLRFNDLCQRPCITKPTRGDRIPPGREVGELIVALFIRQDGDDHPFVVSRLDEGVGYRRVGVVGGDLAGDANDFICQHGRRRGGFCFGYSLRDFCLFLRFRSDRCHRRLSFAGGICLWRSRAGSEG